MRRPWTGRRGSGKAGPGEEYQVDKTGYVGGRGGEIRTWRAARSMASCPMWEELKQATRSSTETLMVAGDAGVCGAGVSGVGGGGEEDGVDNGGRREGVGAQVLEPILSWRSRWALPDRTGHHPGGFAPREAGPPPRNVAWRAGACFRRRPSARRTPDPTVFLACFRRPQRPPCLTCEHQLALLHLPPVHTVRRALVNCTLEGGRSRALVAAPTRPQRFSEQMGVPLRLGLPRQAGIILPSPLPARCDTLRPRREGRRTERGKVRGRAGTPQAQQGSARPAASCAFSRSPDGDGPWRSSALPDPAASWPQFCPARGAPSPGSSPLSLISEPALHAPRLNTRLLLDGPPRIPRHCPIDARGAASMGTARATTQRNEGAIEGSQCS